MYKELIIDDIEELVTTVISEYEDIDMGYRIIAKYDEASAIIKELLQYEETSAYYLEIWNDFEGYDKEFLITVDSSLAILCEPLYQDGICLSYDADKVFIMDGCSQKSVADCDDDIVIVVMYSDSINDEDDREYTVEGKKVNKEVFDAYTSKFRCNDDKPCKVKDKSDDKIKSTSSIASYYINGKKVDKTEYDKKHKEFEKKYEEFDKTFAEFDELMNRMGEIRNRLFFL